MLAPEFAGIFPGRPKTSTKIPISFKRAINAELVSRIVAAHRNFIRSIEQLGVKKLVIGLSGGVDSAVAAAFIKESNIEAMVVVVEVDKEAGLSEETQLAVSLAQKIGIPHEVINASYLYKGYLNIFPEHSVLARVHLRSRLINTILLQFADHYSCFVVDTTDKSEHILKIYEESFRGHFAPLTNFYKSEVYDLADHFGLSEIRQRQSGCPELIDFDAFGVTWEELDPILHLLVEQHMPSHEIVTLYGVDGDWLRQVEQRILIQPLRTTPTTIQLSDGH